MFQVNENYQKLPGSYLFSTIAKKVHPAWHRRRNAAACAGNYSGDAQSGG